jgi:hypothetical protein
MENVMGLIDNRDAQFMLLAGFIIALGLVITTVMLSNITFQSNMAGEAGSDPVKYEIVNMMAISADEMKNAYAYGNATGTNNSFKIANFSIQMQDFSANLSKIYAQHGEGVKVSWNVSNWNQSLYANFTKNGTANGAPNWNVMESIKSISVFELRNVSANGNNHFIITATNQTTGAFLWSADMDISDGVIIINPSIIWVPVSPANFSYINLTDPKYFFNSYVGSNSIKISFINGNYAYGRFKILGITTYGSNFIRARDYILNANVTLSTSVMRANLTIPVSVPW